MKGVIIIIEKVNKKQKLIKLNQKLEELIKKENNWIANLANAAALIYNHLDNLNWAGFYLMEKNELVLGPFQGLPACVRINIGDGVCGKAVANKKTYVVENVHDFPGHIVCDPASKSEMVIPLVEENIIGVLDIDSPVESRFDEIDKRYLQKFAEILVYNSDVN